MRVIATIINSDYKDEFEAQTANLTSWVIEIVEAAFELQTVSRNVSLPSLLRTAVCALQAARSPLFPRLTY